MHKRVNYKPVPGISATIQSNKQIILFIARVYAVPFFPPLSFQVCTETFGNMSDSEASCAAAEGAEAAPEKQNVSPARTPDSSSPSTPDISTDVAPTRKARRRPETQPAAKVQETPKEDEQPAEVVEIEVLLILEELKMIAKREEMKP